MARLRKRRPDVLKPSSAQKSVAGFVMGLMGAATVAILTQSAVDEYRQRIETASAQTHTTQVLIATHTLNPGVRIT
jgi:CDP-diglyceride synthetase